ncbi:MAG: precorrin-6y C5,15-methyltransferase (decarboxylating) subunit CbiE [Veillonellaceae bacterium]|nr:precorrin-6y C5,15-methyltransferase (decarboxylating) subunit CbiE [Veillonellaceae bacterium]
MEHRLIIAGIGPGSPDYILPAAWRAIERATVLVGGQRALDSFARPDQLTYAVGGDMAGLLQFIREQLAGHDVVVMVSGDPGFYSLLELLRKQFPSGSLQVIPGLSSFQVAFARIGLPWQNARILSAHGRQPDPAALVYTEGAILSFLTDGKNNPARIAGWLLECNWPAQARVWLCKNLSYENETILSAPLADALQVQGFDSCVMVVKG